MNNKSIKRKAFKKKWKVYDLTHLHPFNFILPVDQKWIKKSLKIHTYFSSHCFTSLFNKEKHDISDKYHQCPDWRYFCLERYELSKKLLKWIISELNNNKVFFSKQSDFFKVKLENNQKYFVFFRMYKSKNKDHDLILSITSAHLREDNIDFISQKIDFSILLKKIFLNKSPKKPI